VQLRAEALEPAAHHHMRLQGYTLFPEPTIVYEYMAKGSLFSILREVGSGTCSVLLDVNVLA